MRVCLFALFLSACGLPAPRSCPPGAAVAPEAAQYRYNEAYQKATHNSYDLGPSLGSLGNECRIHGFELDLHNNKAGQATPRDWKVYHEHSYEPTVCDELSGCLRQLMTIHLANPQHEVVTVWLELKDDPMWENERNPDDFDGRLRTEIGDEVLFSPANLMSACPGETTLQGAIARCGWPALEELRGRFVFVIMQTPDSKLAQLERYAQPSTVGRLAFLGPDCQDGESGEFDLARADAIFFNLNGHFERGVDVDRAGYVSRYGQVNDLADWIRVKQLRVQFPATDLYDSTELTTDSEPLGPFAPVPPLP